MEATLIFREAALGERCAVPFTVAELSILSAGQAADGKEQRYVVSATGSVGADRGFMHLRRASDAGVRMSASLVCVIDDQEVTLAGRYKIKLSQQSVDVWRIHLKTSPGVRVIGADGADRSAVPVPPASAQGWQTKLRGT